MFKWWTTTTYYWWKKLFWGSLSTETIVLNIPRKRGGNNFIFLFSSIKCYKINRGIQIWRRVRKEGYEVMWNENCGSAYRTYSGYTANLVTRYWIYLHLLHMQDHRHRKATSSGNQGDNARAYQKGITLLTFCLIFLIFRTFFDPINAPLLGLYFGILRNVGPSINRGCF